MKKILRVGLLLFLCALISCNNDSDDESNSTKFNPDIAGIKNFSNYSSIGVASKNATTARTARTVTTNSIDILVGTNKSTNLLEKITFSTSNNSETSDDFYVCAYQDTTPFLFVQFSRTETLTQGYFYYNTSENFSPIYAISKKTGKIYNFGDIRFSNDICYRRNGNTYTIMGDITYSNDAVFISRCNLDTEIKYIYQLSENENIMKIEKYCRVDALGNDGWGHNILADIYGNLLSLKGNYLTSTKELRTTFDGNWIRNYDGKLYKDNFYIDENGNICTGTYSPNPYYLFSDDELLFSKGLEYWYYSIDNANSLKKTGTGHFCYREGIYKVTFADETKSQYEGELIKQIPSDAIKIGSKFFTLENGTVMYYDYLTNTDNSITISNCTVTSISPSTGGIIYNGYGNDFISTVEGFINAETLEISDNANDKNTLFTTIYLTPLN